MKRAPTVCLPRMPSPGVQAFAVNRSGEVLGHSAPSDIPGSTSDGPLRPFLWTSRGGMIDVGTLGASRSAASAINQHGMVVGSSGLNGIATDRAFAWTERDGMVSPGTLRRNSHARAVNDANQIIDDSETLDGTGYGFVWSARTGMVPLAGLGGDRSLANTINRKGQIVGFAHRPGFQPHAAMWVARAKGPPDGQ